MYYYDYVLNMMPLNVTNMYLEPEDVRFLKEALEALCFNETLDKH